MNYCRFSIIFIWLLFSQYASANIISNGGFESCSFENWHKSTDGFGELNIGNDFEIINSGNDCKAKLNIGYYSEPGNSSSWLSAALSENILFYQFDLAEDFNFFNKTLSFEWEVLVEGDGLGLMPSSLNVAFFDGTRYFNESGQVGLLIDSMEITQNKFGVSVFNLNFATQDMNELYLDFRLSEGEVDDFIGASLIIDNVRLMNVNEPPVLLLIPLVVLGVYLRKRLCQI
ncbi:hypothetical protein [Psychrosphaera aestuarii]|uniref:hypothetical protein n=1 Tax=Psychrosphaera aestuarii TaxID=1266052 RepID=UPI001B31D722|nr:hypothetical protein [Psychrosphaera aestuarii]